MLEAPYKVTLKAYGQALLELARRRPEIVCLGLVSQTITRIAELKELYHLTVLVAEQNFNQAIRIADRGYIIVHGKIALAANSADELRNNDMVKTLYLGS